VFPGVDQPGFLLPSNFLLPLDVTVQTESVLGTDMPGKKGKIKKPVKGHTSYLAHQRDQ